MLKREKFSQTFLQHVVHVFVLCAFAITQPVLDIFTEYPQFFAARGTPAGDMLLWLVCLVFAIPLCLSLMLTLAHAISRSLELVLYYVLVVFLVSLIIIPPLTRLGFGSDLWVVLTSVAAGAVFLAIYLKSEQAKQFLSFMAIALVAFPLLFVFHPSLKPLIFSVEEDTRSENTTAKPTNVVMVVFDELPLFSLMNKEHGINELRYPNFAKLAETSIWYRNATAVGEQTYQAIPAILTGQFPPEEAAMAVYVNFEKNLFTLLGESHQINAIEGMGGLCPDFLCAKNKEPLGERLFSLLRDSFFVYAHIVIPPSYAASLPAIDQNWQNFARNRSDFFQMSNPVFAKSILMGMKDRSREVRGPFADFMELLGPSETPKLDYLHIVSPHAPFMYLPSGKSYNGPAFKKTDGLVVNHWGSRWPTVQGFQRAILQVGYVDGLLGQIVARLKKLGLFDETLLIVTSDHGASYHAHESRRYVSDANYRDVMPVPLFIKMPGRKTGEIDESNVETIDIFPTIADALNIVIPYEVDGHSLLDKERLEREEKHLRISKGGLLAAFPTEIELVGVDQMIDLFGERPEEVFLHGPDSQLMGRRVKEFEQAQSPSIELLLDLSPGISEVDLAASYIPARAFGAFHTAEEAPVDLEMPLVVALNGVIAATTWSYHEVDQWLFSAMIPEHAFISGNNEIEVFAIEKVDGEIKLVRFSAYSE